MDDLLGGSKPGFHLGGLEIATKPAEGVLSTEPTFEHTGDFGHSLVTLQSATMGEPGAANQTVEREGFKDIGHGRCVGTGARQGVVRGKLGDHPAVLQKVIPSHQATNPPYGVSASSLPRR